MSVSEDGSMNRRENRKRTRRDESGFAMLLVFVLAAGIAITLFIEVPRIAFESQRAREQMTIDRALQYQRAIQLFYRKYRLYPQTLDDLETTRSIRFLRHRYLDPLTGKEFRLLHVGPSGQLTDSLVQPPPPLPGSTTASGGSGGPNSNLGSTQSSTQTANSAQTPNSSQPSDPNNPNAQAPDPLNMALRRPSDRITPTTPTGGQPGEADSNPPGDQQPQQSEPAQPGQQPVPPGQPGIPGQPAQPPADPNQPGQQPQDPSQQPQPAGQPPQFPGQAPSANAPPGQTPNPGQAPIPGQTFPFPQNLGPQGPQFGAPGATGTLGAATAGGPTNQAANMIQQLLTTPRQPPSSVGNFTTGNTGGIAGVASTAEGKGIHVVNDRTKYKEWEFVYDLKKDKTVMGAAGVAQQQQIQQQMQQGGAGAPGSNPFGSTASGSSTSSTSAAPAAPAPTTPPPSQ